MGRRPNQLLGEKEIKGERMEKEKKKKGKGKHFQETIIQIDNQHIHTIVYLQAIYKYVQTQSSHFSPQDTKINRPLMQQIQKWE